MFGFFGRRDRGDMDDETWKQEQKERARRREEMERERKEQERIRRDAIAKMQKMIKNNNYGYCYKICDLDRLKRFLILGSEFNTYYASGKNLTIESVQCVQRMLNNGQHDAVLNVLVQFNKEGRAPKFEPMLVALGICAMHENMDVRRAAYAKVNSICNIPTKLFKFLEITHNEIVRRRASAPPAPQPFSSQKKKSEKKCAEAGLKELTLTEDVKKEPIENVDNTEEPAKKKRKVRKVKEFKTVKTVRTDSSKTVGWGRMRRQGIANFYTDPEKDPCRLLYLLTKYQQRHDWSHAQVLRNSHPKIEGDDKVAKDLVLSYCTRGYAKIQSQIEEIAQKPGLSESLNETIGYIKALEEVKHLKADKPGDEEKLIETLRIYGSRQQVKEFTTQFTLDASTTQENVGRKKSSIQIVREHVPTPFLRSKKVWEMMLKDMPMTAMIRNLGKMSSLGLFDNNEGKGNLEHVVSALNNEKKLKSARIHPVSILIGGRTYAKGQGDRGSLTWRANKEIVKAMDDAFYKSFRSPEVGQTFKTGKNFLLALDVSGSMQGGGCFGCDVLTPAMGTAAMAMVTWHIEDNVEIMGFGGYFMDLKSTLRKEMTVQEAMTAISRINMGATDCSLPMMYAMEKKLEVDAFIIYTDSETNSRTYEPMQALRIYNTTMNRDAKLLVNAMSATEFSIADPNSSEALDICGFDANVPELINNFITQGKREDMCGICDGCKKKK